MATQATVRATHRVPTLFAQAGRRILPFTIHRVQAVITVVDLEVHAVAVVSAAVAVASAAALAVQAEAAEAAAV